MNDYAFTEMSGFEVNQSIYREHKSYDYEVNGVPRVSLRVCKKGGWLLKKVVLLVDTGAAVSTLKDTSADRIGINRLPEENEIPKILKGAGGLPIVGLLRMMRVNFGKVKRDIKVLVPPKVEMKRNGRNILASEPEQDLLGRSGILENYLLCFDLQRLYAFPKQLGDRT